MDVFSMSLFTRIPSLRIYPRCLTANFAGVPADSPTTGPSETNVKTLLRTGGAPVFFIITFTNIDRATG